MMHVYMYSVVFHRRVNARVAVGVEGGAGV